MGGQYFIKRIFDITVSLIGIILLIPIMILVALAIRIDSKGPIIFVQERVGKNKKLFNIYKFRTMKVHEIKSNDEYVISEDDDKITKVGHFLRKTGLDEIPQLINIIKGDMSIVGPRPTLLYQVEQYDDFKLRRLEVLPGITGLAQINGRNAITWDERIKLDVKYIDNFSLVFDLKILIKTVLVVIKKEDIYGDAKNFEIGD